MRHLASLLLTATVLAACAKSDTGAADTAAATTATPAPAPAPTLSLADIAGKWNVRSVPETGDTTPTVYVLDAKAEPSGWTFTFPNRPPLEMRIVAVEGDSIVAEAGPFESNRRKGVQVKTNLVFRRDGDRLVGTTVAHYATTSPDSVLRLRTEATRAP